MPCQSTVSWTKFELCAKPTPTGSTMTSTRSAPTSKSKVEPARGIALTVAIGESLPDMPSLLTPEVCIPLPLERTYESAWEAVPAFWRDFLAALA
jgi:hypothetical protein